ncbi:uncharacterized protein LOC134215492 isoform X2 [Armigeres subalbatus]|uniref:uncharacterized protein LOC134215492 isoform X2 n=1 Tax=Armigeres subalbatus TaxID=124917 RepID=UPI002ED387E0
MLSRWRRAFFHRMEPKRIPKDAMMGLEGDDDELCEAEKRRHNWIQNFSYKLNTATLSIIEERTDEDSSFTQRSPEWTVNVEGKNSVIERFISLDRNDEIHHDDESSSPVELAVNTGLGNLQVDDVDDEPVPVVSEDNSSERSLKGFENVEKLLDRMPLVTIMRTLRRFRSFEYPRGGAEDSDGSEENVEHPHEEDCELNHLAEEADDTEGEQDEETIMPVDPEEDFDMEAAIDAVLGEASSKVKQTKWNMIRSILHKIPYRANAFDLYGENDEDVLLNLFEQMNNKKLENKAGVIREVRDDI